MALKRKIHKAKRVKGLDEVLTEHLKQEAIWIGDSLRFRTCPLCHETHHDNPAFAVDTKKHQYFAHCCGEGGSVDDILDHDHVDLECKIQQKNEKPKKKIEPKYLYQKLLKIAGEDSQTDLYLQNRGIRRHTWADLDLPLKESEKPYKGTYRVAVYPFLDQAGNVIATQSLFVGATKKEKMARRYSGPKGSGVALLKKSERLIVSEGLETGLSVRQHLGNSYGLMICGDAGNLAKLSGDLFWAIEGTKKIIIAADNDTNGVGVGSARKVFFKLPFKTVIKAPARPGWDWNDVLVKGHIDKEWV